MNVFLSWSGETSKRLARVFGEWLSDVIQTVVPFFSEDDIPPGEPWDAQIMAKLDECRVGIFFITKENVESPWLLFEAGAIAAARKPVCTIFFDLKLEEAKGPLMRFQGGNFHEEHVAKVVKEVHKVLGSPISRETLGRAFVAHWPKLVQQVSGVLEQSKPHVRDGQTAKEKLPFSVKTWDDVLGAIRDLDEHLRKAKKRMDYIVSFSGGGLIVSDLLHVIHRPETPVVSCVVRRYEADQLGSSRKIVIDFPLVDPAVFGGKRVLLLDDVVASGNSMIAVAKFLKGNLAAKQVVTAVLGKATNTPVQLHYSNFEYTGQCVLPYGLVPRSLPMTKRSHQSKKAANRPL